MQTFEITERSTETRRVRKRVVRAHSEQEARAAAEAEGAIIVSISLVPGAAATGRQVAYAKDLGIQIPANATLQELSDLISARLEHDKPAETRLQAFAQEYGLDFTPYIGKKALFDRILNALSKPGRESELVGWFAYRVSRELFRGRPDAPIDSPHHPVIREIANELANDETVIKSIRRYDGHNLIWFGEYTSPDGGFYKGGSNATIAYKKCMALLRGKLGLPTTSMSSGVSEVAAASSGKVKTKGGCLGVVVFLLAGITLLFGAAARVV